jgi:hypothetical protein
LWNGGTPDINRQAGIKLPGKLNTFQPFYHLLFQEPECGKQPACRREKILLCAL